MPATKCLIRNRQTQTDDGFENLKGIFFFSAKQPNIFASHGMRFRFRRLRSHAAKQAQNFKNKSPERTMHRKLPNFRQKNRCIPNSESAALNGIRRGRIKPAPFSNKRMRIKKTAADFRLLHTHPFPGRFQNSSKGEASQIYGRLPAARFAVQCALRSARKSPVPHFFARNNPENCGQHAEAETVSIRCGNC